MESRRVVIPSRRRVGNMRRMLALLPGATVCVHEDERADYAAVVPAGQLLCHKVEGIANIRNWLNRTIQEDCLVEVDDDLRGVRPLIGSPRVIADPEVIAQVLENGHRICEDLGLGVFCFSRTRNSFLADPEMQPVRVVQPICCSFGLRGPARKRDFDPGLPGRADFDFTLQTLLVDRILIADMRWYFEHGRIFSGKGGAVGLIGKDDFAQSTEKLHKEFGPYVGKKRPGFMKGKGTTSPMSIVVKRQSELARQLSA
jgi:hypothetical protein